jgi:signal transduction histidine kinase
MFRQGRGQPTGGRRARTRSIGVTLVGLLLFPLVALVALWALVASITVGSALAEHNYNRVGAATARYTDTLLTALEQERLQTFLWLTSPRRPPVSQLTAVRQADDVAISAYEHGFGGTQVARQALIAELRKVPTIRAAVDSGAMTAADAFQAYNNLVDGLFAVYTATGQADTALYQQTLAAIDAGRALEQFTRELALTAGAGLAGGQMSAADGVLFAEAVGSQNLLAQDAIAQADGQLHASLVGLYSSPLHARVAALEDQIAAGARDRASVAVTLRAWGPVSGEFLDQMLKVANSDARPLVAQAGQAGDRLFLEAGLAGGLGLLAVLGALLLMIRFGRNIRRELTSLHDGAQAMATERLPSVIERLREGDEVDVAAESPPLRTGRITEIARVADAFSSVQRTAVDAAVGQASLRKGISQVFLNLSLRNQSLLHRQLSMLDTLERATDDPAALADLFRLDHLTTRMRRHAEGLIILSGAQPGRSWHDPVPVVDVLRAAVAEVEDYVRVDIASESADSVIGVAANDLVHMIAELVENATAFSPPTTRVEIRTDAVGAGVAVEIEDRGLGLTPDERAEINARLASPPGFDLASEQLGLFVVGQLGARHGIKVSLRESHYGGVTAIVLMPHSIIVKAGETGSADADTGYARTDGGAQMSGPADVSPAAASPVPSALSLSGRHRFDSPQPPQRLAPGEAGRRAAGEPWGGRYSAFDPDQTDVRGPFQPPRRQDPDGEPEAGEPARDGTHRGLPRRVRLASLAPQLRSHEAGAHSDGTSTTGASAWPSPGGRVTEHSPEDTRSRMASLQDGWLRGRKDDVAGVDWPDEGPGAGPGAGLGGHADSSDGEDSR